MKKSNYLFTPTHTTHLRHDHCPQTAQVLSWRRVPVATTVSISATPLEREQRCTLAAQQLEPRAALTGRSGREAEDEEAADAAALAAQALAAALLSGPGRQSLSEANSVVAAAEGGAPSEEEVPRALADSALEAAVRVPAGPITAAHFGARAAAPPLGSTGGGRRGSAGERPPGGGGALGGGVRTRPTMSHTTLPPLQRTGAQPPPPSSIVFLPPLVLPAGSSAPLGSGRSDSSTARAGRRGRGGDPARGRGLFGDGGEDSCESTPRNHVDRRGLLVGMPPRRTPGPFHLGDSAAAAAAGDFGFGFAAGGGDSAGAYDQLEQLWRSSGASEGGGSSGAATPSTAGGATPATGGSSPAGTPQPTPPQSPRPAAGTRPRSGARLVPSAPGPSPRARRGSAAREAIQADSPRRGLADVTAAAAAGTNAGPGSHPGQQSGDCRDGGPSAVALAAAGALVAARRPVQATC